MQADSADMQEQDEQSQTPPTPSIIVTEPPATSKRPRTPAQLKATESMKQKRVESIKQKQHTNGFANNLRASVEDFNNNLMYDRERDRLQKKKDAKWSKLIDERFDSFEGKLFNLLGGPIDDFVNTSKKRKKETPEKEPVQPETKPEPVPEPDPIGGGKPANSRGRFANFF